MDWLEDVFEAVGMICLMLIGIFGTLFFIGVVICIAAIIFM